MVRAGEKKRWNRKHQSEQWKWSGGGLEEDIGYDGRTPPEETWKPGRSERIGPRTGGNGKVTEDGGERWETGKSIHQTNLRLSASSFTVAAVAASLTSVDLPGWRSAIWSVISRSFSAATCLMRASTWSSGVLSVVAVPIAPSTVCTTNTSINYKHAECEFLYADVVQNCLEMSQLHTTMYKNIIYIMLLYFALDVSD